MKFSLLLYITCWISHSLSLETDASSNENLQRGLTDDDSPSTVYQRPVQDLYNNNNHQAKINVDNSQQGSERYYLGYGGTYFRRPSLDSSPNAPGITDFTQPLTHYRQIFPEKHNPYYGNAPVKNHDTLGPIPLNPAFDSPLPPPKNTPEQFLISKLRSTKNFHDILRPLKGFAYAPVNQAGYDHPELHYNKLVNDKLHVAKELQRQNLIQAKLKLAEEIEKEKILESKLNHARDLEREQLSHHLLSKAKGYALDGYLENKLKGVEGPIPVPIQLHQDKLANFYGRLVDQIKQYGLKALNLKNPYLHSNNNAEVIAKPLILSDYRPFPPAPVKPRFPVGAGPIKPKYVDPGPPPSYFPPPPHLKQELLKEALLKQALLKAQLLKQSLIKSALIKQAVSIKAGVGVVGLPVPPPPPPPPPKQIIHVPEYAKNNDGPKQLRTLVVEEVYHPADYPDGAYDEPPPPEELPLALPFGGPPPPPPHERVESTPSHVSVTTVLSKPYGIKSYALKLTGDGDIHSTLPPGPPFPMVEDGLWN